MIIGSHWDLIFGIYVAGNIKQKSADSMFKGYSVNHSSISVQIRSEPFMVPLVVKYLCDFYGKNLWIKRKR